jgi:hypothetical protein
MHETQLRQPNTRPCPAAHYNWVNDKNLQMVGLPKTRAGTYYLPSKIGDGWYKLENGATSIDEVYRRIDLLFRNRQAEIWRAAARSAFEHRRLISSLPEVMQYFLKLDALRKSVWTIIGDSVANGANLSTISPGCRLHADGYAGLYTPDVQLWAVIHAATDVDPAKLTYRTGRTTTAAELKKMFKDALSSDNYFGISPAELAAGEYRLPRLAHYDGALDMDSIVGWLRNTIGMSPYMVHAHFRPFLRRSHLATPGERHQLFSSDRLSPCESIPPTADESLHDFAEDHDWTPKRGPRGRFSHPSYLPTSSATASASSASTESTANVSVPATPEDAEMADLGVTSASAPSVAPQAATS